MKSSHLLGPRHGDRPAHLHEGGQTICRRTASALHGPKRVAVVFTVDNLLHLYVVGHPPAVGNATLEVAGPGEVPRPPSDEGYDDGLAVYFTRLLLEEPV